MCTNLGLLTSLKGQLSNVEGSVKSMKAAVVVGSVLTVACLAAVFGVTVLANEVSKEVKVSNGTLSTKSGKSVLTASTVMTTKADENVKSVTITTGDEFQLTSKVNAVVVQGETTTIVCDDLVQVLTDGAMTSFSVTEGSVLASVLTDVDAVEKRTMNGAASALDDILRSCTGWKRCVRALLKAGLGYLYGQFFRMFNNEQ